MNEQEQAQLQAEYEHVRDIMQAQSQAIGELQTEIISLRLLLTKEQKKNEGKEA